MQTEGQTYKQTERLTDGQTDNKSRHIYS